MKRTHFSIFCVLFILSFTVNAYREQYCTASYTASSSSMPRVPLQISAYTAQKRHSYSPSKKFSYTFNDPRIDISRLSERKARSYFTAFNATPAQILRNPVWFMSDAFIAVVHTFPEYEEALTHHAATITALTFLNTCARWFNNQYCVGLKKRIRTLLDQHIQRQLRASGYSPSYQQTLEALQQHLDVHKDIYPSALYEQRRTALAQTIAKPHAQSRRTYSVPPLRSDEIHPEQLNAFTGNHYEHQLQTEFLTQLEELNHTLTSDNAVTRSIQIALAQGLQSNREHKTQAATTWADYGWKALAITRGMFEGVGEGTLRTAQAFINPVQTLQNIAAGLHSLATLTETTLQTIRSFENAFFSGKLTQCATLARTLGAYAQDHATALIRSLINTPPEHTAREATAIVTEFLLSHKLWSTIATQLPKGNTHAHILIDHEFSQIRTLPKPEPILVTIEASYKSAPALARTYDSVPALTRTPALLMQESDEAVAVNKGGPKAAQKISPIVAAATTGPKIAEKITRLLIPAPHHIAELEKAFEGYCMFDNHPVSIDAEHLCAFYERIKVKRSGHRQPPRLYGGHHDCGRRLEKAGRIQYENVVEGPAGSFEAETIIDGVRYPAKTYFNPDWTEQHVIEKTFEAFDNRHKILPLDSSNCYTIFGKTSEGLEIKMFLDTTTWRITTSFPHL